MAKKKGSGSNLGLIITLVFFVLSTVILGVTTYMGYSALDEKEKAVAQATQAKGVAENDAKWYRDQSRILQARISKAPSGVDATEVAQVRHSLIQGQLSHAANQKDKEEFIKLEQTLNARFPWDTPNSTAPSLTIEQWIAQKDQEVALLRAQLTKAQEALVREKQDRQQSEEELNKEIASLKNAQDAFKNKALADRKTDLNQISVQAATLRDEEKIRNDLKIRLDQTTKDLEKQLNLVKRLTGDLADAKAEVKRLRESEADKTSRLAALLEKTGQDPRAIDAAVLDARSAQILRDWRRDWRIVDLDRRGTMPYINLGSADGLVPQVTFSIHSVGADGKLSPVAKGTLEVVRVIGSHLAQARVTSVTDAKNDPIVKGDRLFNPTWDPDRKKRVAIAGLADIGSEGIENTEDLRKLLARQNVILDAYIDVKDREAPRIVGKGITVNTDYLILADSLEAVHHPKSRDKTYVQQFEKLIREMKDQAVSNGVQVIGLQKYLEMIGYRQPRVTSTLPSYTR